MAAAPLEIAMHYHYYRPFPRPHAERGRHRHHEHARTQAWRPRVDIREDADAYVILADLPGIDPAQIELLVEGNELKLAGERETADDRGLTRVERHSGAFARHFLLPEDADAEGISASGANGVLEVRIPRRPQPGSRRIPVGVRPLDAGQGGESVQ
jgi:HSP20 family protein